MTLAKKYAAILSVGIVYFFIVLFVGHGIPCLFHKLTGLRCPGCGVTRMIMALARLDFSGAFRYNQFLFITGPFILAYLVFYDLKIAISAERPSKKWDAGLYVILALAIIFGILRNIVPI